jgi:hypothetical protein
MARTKSKKKKSSPQIGEKISDKMSKPVESQDKRGSSILQKFAWEVKAKTSFTKILIKPEGEISVSDAILKIIAPYRDAAQDYESFHKLVVLACIAWNAAILPAKQREGMLAHISKLMPNQQSREDFTKIVKELMKRKNKLYPNVNRMIIEFKVTERKNDFHIAVASTIEKLKNAE